MDTHDPPIPKSGGRDHRFLRVDAYNARDIYHCMSLLYVGLTLIPLSYA